MRTILSFSVALLLALSFCVGALPAAPPTPGPALPDSVVADSGVADGGLAPRSNAAGIDAPDRDASSAEKRNWLLARLIVDQNFDPDKVRAVEQKLSAMSADQLDLLVRVYRQKQQQREVASQAVLDEARENLEQAKATRDALAEDVANVRAARQQQYSNFGVTYGGSNGIGYGYSPFGFGPYGAGAFAGRPIGPGFGYGPSVGYPPVYGYGGYPVNGLGPVSGYGPPLGYGAGMGYAAPYPVYGGMGAGY